MQTIYAAGILLACWIAAYIATDAITIELEHERAEVRNARR